jgi:hypothetical protein
MKTSPHDWEQHIRAYYQQKFGEPSPSDTLWSQIAERLPMQEHSPSWWQRIRRMLAQSSVATLASARKHHFVMVGTLVCVLVVVSSLVYAIGILGSSHVYNAPGVSPTQVDALLVAKLLQNDPRQSIQELAQIDQFTVNQAQTVNASTVRIQKILADANNIILVYTIDGSAALFFSPKGEALQPIITLSGGQPLPFGGWNTQSDTMNDAHSIAILAWFDAASIGDKSQYMNLQIAIPSGGTAEAHFDIRVPFYAGKTIMLNKTVTSNGQLLTIDRVVITLSTTRIYYTTGLADLGSLFVSLSIGESTYKFEVKNENGFLPESESYMYVWDDLQEKTGTWVMEIATNSVNIGQGSWHLTFLVLTPRRNWLSFIGGGRVSRL